MDFLSALYCPSSSCPKLHIILPVCEIHIPNLYSFLFPQFYGILHFLLGRMFPEALSHQREHVRICPEIFSRKGTHKKFHTQNKYTQHHPPHNPRSLVQDIIPHSHFCITFLWKQSDFVFLHFEVSEDFSKLAETSLSVLLQISSFFVRHTVPG